MMALKLCDLLPFNVMLFRTDLRFHYGCGKKADAVYQQQRCKANLSM